MHGVKQSVQWLILAACALAIIELAGGCPKGDGAPVGGTVAGTPQVNTAAVEDLYNRNCSICHGKSLEGRPTMAPALVGLANNWKTPEEMSKYLANPQGYANADRRLAHLHDTYSLRMPAIPTMTDEERLALAKWVLTH